MFKITTLILICQINLAFATDCTKLHEESGSLAFYIMVHVQTSGEKKHTLAEEADIYERFSRKTLEYLEQCKDASKVNSEYGAFKKLANLQFEIYSNIKLVASEGLIDVADRTRKKEFGVIDFAVLMVSISTKNEKANALIKKHQNLGEFAYGAYVLGGKSYTGRTQSDILKIIGYN
ncbi:MAG: hypothetical protein HRT73_14995 [Flavobacteriales bacterium]|nr:hypothetical protein [Flavobacteriales bacterium]